MGWGANDLHVNNEQKKMHQKVGSAHSVCTDPVQHVITAGAGYTIAVDYLDHDLPEMWCIEDKTRSSKQV